MITITVPLDQRSVWARKALTAIEAYLGEASDIATQFMLRQHQLVAHYNGLHDNTSVRNGVQFIADALGVGVMLTTYMRDVLDTHAGVATTTVEPRK